jgi:beta-lactamase superfamily II metal-dependent hydrolase
MAATLRVRAYNVRFGDAILVTVPDKDPRTRTVTTRHILIDVGNVLSGAGGVDDVFKPAIDDVITELGGKPLDLYVMTHEHLDHIQGLFHVASRVYPNGEFARRFSADYAWLSASAATDYYDTHPEAKRKKDLYLATYATIARHLTARPEAASEPFRSWLLNNNPRSTEECVAFLRALATKKTTYVYRGVDLRGTHPFREAKFTIWAPEEDTSEYYGRFQPMALGSVGSAQNGNATSTNITSDEPRPPAGVDAGAFLQLVDARRRGFADNLLAIDQAANNTSIVFCLEWRGWRLLFPGDAEIRSWRTMAQKGVLEPVHFLKVAHHGSHNGTPDGEIFDAILPEDPPDDRGRVAVISTYTGTYGGIPHEPTNTRLKTRCKLHSTLASPTKPYVDITFEG